MQIQQGKTIMRPSEPQLIEDFIDRIPLVGRLWTDALYTWIGVANALNLRELREDRLQLPDSANIVNLRVDEPGPSQRAA
jgi:hypothetical protein